MSAPPRATLLLKLVGAFLLVILIGALVIFLLVSRATQSAFRLYTTQSSQLWAQQLAPAYAEFYSRANSWAGVEDFIVSEPGQPSMGGMMNGQGHGRGMGGMGAWMGGMGQRLILAGPDGRVIADTSSELTGAQLSADELAAGAPVVTGGQMVGTLIVTPADVRAVTDPAGIFLATVNRSILISVLIAAALSLLLVLLFFFQITAPLRQMQKAAGAIARGDLKQRVPVRSNDELGDLARSFNQMAGSLASAEDQRRKLLADVAHELRTPMAVIRAHAEGMQDGVLPLDLAQVNAIHAETMLLGRMIDDLRLLSLAEAGELRLERGPVDLADLLAQAVERLRPQCRQKEVSLDLETPAGLPPVEIDGDRITQVVTNLVGNSLRYTPPGGTILLRAERANGGVRVSVSDNGPGIPTEELPWIFDRFYRVDKSRTRASGGSGLGLAIVKQLVEAHGGSVQAESPVSADPSNPGTRISFTLPAAK